MCIFLTLLCILCVARVHSIFDGACVQKDPPPGVLVLAPNSALLLTCRGHVMVNGVTVNIGRSRTDTNRRSRSVVPTTSGSKVHRPTVSITPNYRHHLDSAESAVTGENRSPRYTDTGFTTQMDAQTAVSRLLKSESNWEEEEKNSEGDYQDKEAEEGNRVTRGIDSSPRWKWTGKTMGNGKEDSLERRGTTLSLSSARLTDSGNYSCHHRGREMFSLKVIVADPPKSPSLSCYKKSPTGKIRCESETQEPSARPYSCSLMLTKSPLQPFSPVECSYSYLRSRYWCALDYNEDELRTSHTAYLCLTSITGKATSTMLSFTPMGILKPDPPTDLKVYEIKGRTTYMRVTWNYPSTWKSQNYYFLIYNIKYKPLRSSFHYEQEIFRKTMDIEIRDVLPGVEYQIRVRTKDEYDGQWSDWSAPVSGRSWTEPSVVYTTSQSTNFTEDASTPLAEAPTLEPLAEEVWYHALWISGCFLLLSVILAVYIFRHKDRFMPKLHHLSVITQHSHSSQPPPPHPEAPEVQVLVPFPAPHCREPPPSNAGEAEEENEEALSLEERMETMNFNNTSYFLLRTE